MTVSDAPLKPGVVRTFKKGKGSAVVLAIGVWAKRRGKQFHIHITGTKTFHITVTNDPKSERYHRTLFRDLRRLLVDNQCWPYGDAGAETERSG
jgi:glycine/D-amino acid oxidase-like deaminating enzyme